MASWRSKLMGQRRELAPSQDNVPTTNWQQLYWTEVRLRQTEAARAQATIDQLQAQLQRPENIPPIAGVTPEDLSALRQEVAQYQTVLELKAKLLEVLCDRQRLLAQVQELRQALAAEQEAHVWTQQSLTTSLSDVMESLVQAQAKNST